MTKNTKSFVLPLTFIGIMFFAIGFALGINSLLVPVLQKSLGISNTASYLIIAATFIPFLVFGYPAGLTIKACPRHRKGPVSQTETLQEY